MNEYCALAISEPAVDRRVVPYFLHLRAAAYHPEARTVNVQGFTARVDLGNPVDPCNAIVDAIARTGDQLLPPELSYM